MAPLAVAEMLGRPHLLLLLGDADFPDIPIGPSHAPLSPLQFEG